MLVKNASVIGHWWGDYGMRDREQLDAAFEHLFAITAQGVIRTLVSDVLSLEQVPSGLRRYGRSKGVEQAVALPFPYAQQVIAIAKNCIRSGARGRFYNIVDLVSRLHIAKRPGLPGLRIYDPRHTYVSFIDAVLSAGAAHQRAYPCVVSRPDRCRIRDRCHDDGGGTPDG